jgi:hypothetical protein
MLGEAHSTKEYAMLFVGAVVAGVLLYFVESYLLPPAEKAIGIGA